MPPPARGTSARQRRSPPPSRRTQKFLRFHDDFAPDAVVCTHFLPLEILATRARMAQNACTLGRPQAAAEIVADVVRR